MGFLNQDLSQEILRMTWLNPAFMAILIALIWLIPQLIIRKIMFKKYKESKIKKQEQKIEKLYPKTLK